MSIESITQHASLKTATYEPPFWEDNPPKLLNRLGVNRRYLTQPPGEEYVERSKVIPEMGCKVLDNLLSQKGWPVNTIDRLLVSTSYPYGESPSLQIAQAAGASKAQCFDYYGACPGSIIALSDLYENRDVLKVGERVVIIASEQYSPTVDSLNKFVFGDGASGYATAWEVDSTLLGCQVATFPDLAGLIKMPKVMQPPYPPQTRSAVEIPESESPYLEMQNRVMLDFLKRTCDLNLGVPHPIELAEKVIEESGYKFSDIDVLVCHQSSGPAVDILENFAKEKGFRGLFPKTVRNFGNTSSDTIFRTFHYANLEQPFPSNAKICLVSFGAGLTVASALIELT